MATIVNTPAAQESNSGMGFFLGIVLLVVFGVIFFYYFAPALISGLRGAGGGETNITVPKDINVNVQNK